MTISRSLMERQLRAGGGIMTLEEPRQGYFLGKLVKKAKRAVKKVVKSPIGKAALIGGLGAYAGGLGPFSSGKFGAGFLRGTGSNLLTGLKSRKGFLGGIGNIFREGGDKNADFSALRLLGGGLGAAAIASPFLMGGDEEEIIDESTPFNLAQPMVSDIRDQARSYYQDPTKSALYFMPPKSAVQSQFYAAGGGLADIPRGGYEDGEMVMKDLSKDPNYKGWLKLYEKNPEAAMMNENANEYLRFYNSKAEGGIMDLGGMEKDYREGGFVPLGAEERADDVPARLSKNEFVFTADAVRNAGQGDIDKGAEVMQNMMDNLEAGGTISEESQGEENPAQAMFDQSQMLENRIV